MQVEIDCSDKRVAKGVLANVAKFGVTLPAVQHGSDDATCSVVAGWRKIIRLYSRLAE